MDGAPQEGRRCGLDKALGGSRNDIDTLLDIAGICIISPTDECTQFDEYLVRMKAITITLYKIGGGVMIHRSVVGKRRWLMECAFSMKHDNQIVYIDTETISEVLCSI